MARNQISSVAFGQVNSAVRTLPGASVRVENGSGGLATLYTSEDGAETLENPLRADPLGRYECFVGAAEASYTITVTLGPITYTWTFYPPSNVAAAGLIYEETWADLVGRTSNLDGAAAEVTNDAGTHLDATDTGYDGGSVANLGRYRWNEAWGRWERLEDLAPVLYGQPYSSVEALEAAQVPGIVSALQVIDGETVYTYIRSGVAADIQSADGQWWVKVSTDAIFTQHAANTGNPHAVTYTQTGAAAAIQALDDELSGRLDDIAGDYVAAGEWYASSGSFPSGPVSIGSFYNVPVGGEGTVDGVSFEFGDQLLPLVTNPSTTTYAGNWKKNPRPTYFTLSYATRAQAVAANNAGAHALLADGIVIEANGVRYKKEQGATAIPDFLNFVPAGQPYFLHWGAVGDCTGAGVGTPDDDAIQAALDWLTGGDFRSLEDAPAGGYRWRIFSGLNAATSSGVKGSRLVMRSPITQDAGCALALRLSGFRHAHFEVRCFEGGSDADYTQADPVGATEFFQIANSRKCYSFVQAIDFPGRVIRVKSGSIPWKNSFHNMEIDTGDISGVAGATPPGQTCWMESGTAFGNIAFMNSTWEVYGSVFRNMDDINIEAWEGGSTNPGAPITFDNVGSIQLGTVNLGEGTGQATLMKFTNGCARIGINKFFAVTPDTALLVENTDSGEFGIKIDYAETRNSSSPAIILDSVYGADINLMSDSDDSAIEIKGTSRDIYARVQSRGSGKESVIIGGTADNVNISGFSRDAGQDSAGTYACARVGTTGDVFFTDFDTYGTSPLASYELVASNNVVIQGGRLESGNVVGGVLPKEARGVRGLKTEAEGTATIAAGTAFVDIAHGLIDTPNFVQFTGRGSQTKDVFVGAAPDATNIRAQVGASVTGNQTVYWRACINEAFGQ